MPYLLAGDLNTHIYSENLNEIVRDDNSIIYSAIDKGIDEAKNYLRRFDLLKVFGSDAVEPVVQNEDLKDKVKDLVLWKLVKLGQVNMKIELARTSYEDSIRWFEKVAAGRIDPGLPMPANDPGTDYREDDMIQWDSNKKRENHY